MGIETTILEGLNPAQREAVEAIEGPLLIVAGPGSGKTRVITHRIAYLIRVCGISPHRILAVTFTNKAAREMNERLQHLVGSSVDRLTVGTFHAFCAALLRREGKHIGLDPSFTIYDQEDQMAVVKQALEEADLNSKQFPPRAVHGVISRAKSLLVDPQTLSINHQTHFEDQAAKVYLRYEEILARNNGLDFDDLLFKAVHLLQNNAEILKKYQNRYLHILVDEFQDTNVSQYALAKLLAAENRNMCVVGDADQSIYSWRHADIRNILSFQRDFPEARTVALEENYRSTRSILAAAKHLISSNRMRLAKDLWTQNETGHPVIVHEVYDEEEEAQFIIKEANRLANEESIQPGDCAVLYRVNAQSRALEEACLRYGMKYRLVGGIRFYQRHEVKDVMAYLRLLNNPSDDVSLARIINVPQRGIGQRSVEDLAYWARSQGISMFSAMERIAEDGELSSHPVATRIAKLMVGFVTLVNGLREEAGKLDVVELIDTLLERSGYRQHVQERMEKPDERWENIMELRTTAQEFRLIDPPDGLRDLLERLSLVADVDTYEPGADALTLITLHQAKGLEFPVVFIAGMEEGLLPHVRSMDSAEELEEERRLCYVGMTRSKNRLYLLRAFRRGFMGGSGPRLPSRFLKELPPDLLVAPPSVAAKRKSVWTAQEPLVTAIEPELNLPSLRTGDKVRHATFGDGMVVSSVSSGADYEVTVAFEDGAGVKRLLLSYAHLEKLE